MSYLVHKSAPFVHRVQFYGFLAGLFIGGVLSGFSCWEVSVFWVIINRRLCGLRDFYCLQSMMAMA